MTSAPVRHARDTSRSEGSWMVVFAAVLLGMLGLFNIIDGIAAIARSSVFIGKAFRNSRKALRIRHQITPGRVTTPALSPGQDRQRAVSGSRGPEKAARDRPLEKAARYRLLAGS